MMILFFLLVFQTATPYWPDAPTPRAMSAPSSEQSAMYDEIQANVKCVMICLRAGQFQGAYPAAVAAVVNGGVIHGYLNATCTGIFMVMAFWAAARYLNRLAQGVIIENRDKIRR